MAEAPKEGSDPLWSVIGFIIIATLLMSWLSNFPFFNDGSLSNLNKDNFSISRLFPQGEIAVGKKVINKSLNEIRQQVGGSVIGTQAKRVVGTIVEGPVERFGRTWWRVDYEKAPDGWVEGNSITGNIGLFRAFNILPILYDYFIKPVGTGLTIIGAIILIIIHFMMRGANEHEAKLQAVRRERALAYYKPELLQSEQAVVDAGEVPDNLPTGDISEVPAFNQDAGVKNERWEGVVKLMNSYNENDWKQAIIEADTILENMVDRMGYDGETIGDKMKKIEPSDFVTLDSAWEAHRVRNKIAHSGSMFKLTKDEAERVIGLYKKVFQEFYYI